MEEKKRAVPGKFGTGFNRKYKTLYLDKKTLKRVRPFNEEEEQKCKNSEDLIPVAKYNLSIIEKAFIHYLPFGVKRKRDRSFPFEEYEKFVNENFKMTEVPLQIDEDINRFDERFKELLQKFDDPYHQLYNHFSNGAYGVLALIWLDEMGFDYSMEDLWFNYLYGL